MIGPLRSAAHAALASRPSLFSRLQPGFCHALSTVGPGARCPRRFATGFQLVGAAPEASCSKPASAFGLCVTMRAWHSWLPKKRRQ